MDRRHRQGWPLFDRLPQDCLGTGRRLVLHFADVAQQGERGHAMAEATSSRLVIRSTSGVSMHSEATRQGVGGPGCARSLARSRAARHHIRRDARVWAQPKWIFSLVAFVESSNPARDTRSRSPRRAHASRAETGRNDWAAPEPVTGWITRGCRSTPGRAAAQQAAGRGFETCHRNPLQPSRPSRAASAPAGPLARPGHSQWRTRLWKPITSTKTCPVACR